MTIFPNWFAWVEQLQSLAQAGLTYSKNDFDLDRYRQIQGIAAEILSAGTDVSIIKTKQLLIEEHGYATPKLDVRGVVIDQNKVLLVKELSDGKWTLPGGWVDVGESPAYSAEREVWEESGYKVKVNRLLALYDNRKHDFYPTFTHIYKIFFLCELIGGSPKNSIETSDAQFFPLDAIPTLSSGRITHNILNSLINIALDPNAATDFD
jgi:ADP-ribose pyrophosphatase YjhB (NUDIX family)